MASSSGNSSGTTKILRNSSSEEDLNPNPNQHLIDERKRKRMESNRESARRSRMRKQKLLDDLTIQVTDLRNKNTQILNTISVATQQFLNVEAENTVLRAQLEELSHRLDSLNEILAYIAAGAAAGAPAMTPASFGCCAGQLPIMASVDYHDFGY